MDTEELLLWYAGYVLCLFFYLRSVTTNIYAEESKTALGILVYAGLIKSKMLREKEGNNLGTNVCDSIQRKSRSR